MASSAGRRNILRELSSPGGSGSASNIPSSSFATTPTSPDETVIQQRGQKKKSATYNYDAPDPVFFKTPTKSPKKMSVANFFSPAKTGVRSSPRKRLHMSPERNTFNETGMAELSISGKRSRKQGESKSGFEKGLEALSHAQLVELLRATMAEVPAARRVAERLCPEPDISVSKAQLLKLQRNVFKTYPRNIWGSQEDSYCYLRVRTHLEAFKTECVEVCDRLVESRQWPIALEYIMYAIQLNHGLPDWSNVAHNKLKKNTKKSLLAHFIFVVKNGFFTSDALTEVIRSLEEMQGELGGDPELEICFQEVRKFLPAARKNEDN